MSQDKADVLQRTKQGSVGGATIGGRKDEDAKEEGEVTPFKADTPLKKPSKPVTKPKAQKATSQVQGSISSAPNNGGSSYYSDTMKCVDIKTNNKN